MPCYEACSERGVQSCSLQFVPKMEPKETAETPAKIMVREIEELCKLKDRSAFREVGDSIRYFDWDTLWQELARKAPTLLHFYRQLFCGASKALICFAISMIIKWRSPKMGLVQRVISTVLCTAMVQISR